MKIASLFTGIGGFDLAADWMNWEVVLQVEKDPFCNIVLNYYWPNTDKYEDIKKTDFKKYRGAIDIVCGGFPCQPYSLAGKREGTEDDRHLWPEMFRAIQEIQPSYVVAENVYGIVNWAKGLVFEQVQIDLENEGYQVQSVILPACALNAPHRRDRVRIIAYSESKQSACKLKQQKLGKKKQGELRGSTCKSSYRTTSNTKCSRQQKQKEYNRQMRAKKNKEKKTNRFNNVREWPTQPPVCGGNDGLPSKLSGITFPKWREESIKAYGNAIVPQLAFEIFQVIKEMEI